MLRRARIGVPLGIAVLLAFVPVDALRLPAERYAEAVWLRTLGCALLLPLLVVARTNGAERWSEWIGAAAVVVLIAVTAAMMPLFRGVEDPQYAIQGTGIVFCVLGAGLILPFDTPKMLALGFAGVAFHAAFTWHFPPARNFPVLFATFVGAVIATVGAAVLTRGRLREFGARRAKEELLRARADFVAMLTHDIKHPLGVIAGYVGMIRDAASMTPAERDRLLVLVEGSVRNALTLATNFLDASKLEADRSILRKEPTDVREVLRQAVSNHRCLADSREVRVLEEQEAAIPRIAADPLILDRIFANLVDNAIKHTPPGGTVRVAASFDPAVGVEVTIEDTGSGLPPGSEARIFDRYTTAASRADSTGLGLYIARSFTIAHGGTISAENRDDGPGARFRVTFPGGEAPPLT
jgi:signal transduction histidine kinase